jgi:hypothetical protein
MAGAELMVEGGTGKRRKDNLNMMICDFRSEIEKVAREAPAMSPGVCADLAVVTLNNG